MLVSSQGRVTCKANLQVMNSSISVNQLRNWRTVGWAIMLAAIRWIERDEFEWILMMAVIHGLFENLKNPDPSLE